MNVRAATFAAAALLAAWTPPATAENKTKDGEGWKACQADAARLCPGSDKPGMCLHEHLNELSPGCRQFKEGMKARWQNKSEGHAGKESEKGPHHEAKKVGEGGEGKSAIRFQWSDKKKQAEDGAPGH
jgi:hypothetical protein